MTPAKLAPEVGALARRAIESVMTPLNSDEIETQSNVSAETIAERSAGDSADERAVIDGGTARCCWQGETMGYGLAAQAIPYADHADELARTPHRDTL